MVLSQFGIWPSFHDGEVHRIVLDRSPHGTSEAEMPTLEIWIRAWIMKMSEGQYLLENDSVVHLLFEGVSEVQLEGFNQQNVLTSLKLSIDTDLLCVELEHCYEFCAGFRARKAKVVGVQPYDMAADS